jgi:preprotein translocase subunit SecE
MITTENVHRKSRLDLTLWLIALALIVVGVWANYSYQMIDISFRIMGWIALVALSLAIILLTSQGKRVLAFAKDARAELFKVVWPTRKETVQTTMILIGLVILLSLIIWGLDSFLYWFIGLLTGQRG